MLTISSRVVVSRWVVALAFSILLLAVGCGRLDRRSLASLRAIASGVLRCDAESLLIRNANLTDWNDYGATAEVTACGQRARYVHIAGQWIFDGAWHRTTRTRPTEDIRPTVDPTRGEINTERLPGADAGGG
jgi:hypothetical protein